MCESNAYFKNDDSEELVLKEVMFLKPLENGEILLENILGEQKTVKGKIQEIDFMTHKIILE
jgi:predicted RNA-binding protein